MCRSSQFKHVVYSHRPLRAHPCPDIAVGTSVERHPIVPERQLNLDQVLVATTFAFHNNTSQIPCRPMFLIGRRRETFSDIHGCFESTSGQPHEKVRNSHTARLISR